MTPLALSEQIAVLDKTNALARLEGLSVSLDEALSKAAELIAKARFPAVIAAGGLASVNAALELAEHAEACFLLAGAEASIKELQAWQDRGGYLTSKREAIARADIVLTVGARAASELSRLFSTWPAGRKPAVLEVSSEEPRGLKTELACLAALASAKPPPSLMQPSFERARELVEKLKSARFGVALWSIHELDSLEFAALMALVNKLNEETRFTTLPFHDDTWGASQMCLARWGIYPPARWVRERALPLPGGTSGQDVMRNSDLIVAVSSRANVLPLPDIGRAQVIAITPDAAQLRSAVAIETGAAGLDFNIGYDGAADTYTAVPVEGDSEKPSASQVVNALLLRARGSR